MFLIDGLSGTGKTTVQEELVRRGFHAVDADAAFGFYGDPKTGQTAEAHQLNWIWDSNKLKALAKATKEENVYICGGAMNQNDFSNIFKKQFTLKIDDETLKRRIFTRDNGNSFGKEPSDFARLLEWNQGIEMYAKSIGSVVIDATRPLEAVVDDIVSLSVGSITR
jgi:thymidylate kinase